MRRSRPTMNINKRLQRRGGTSALRSLRNKGYFWVISLGKGPKSTEQPAEGKGNVVQRKKETCLKV